MPYRRLPNTDSARLKALRTAVEKAADTDFRELSVSPHLITEAKSTLMHFERLCGRYQQMYDTQVQANKLFMVKAKNARMYLSHFVQVLYMSILRTEIKEEHLSLYGLEECNMIVPDISTNEQLLEWGQKIIEGENARISRGAVPIYNPSIAKVKVMYTLFKEGYQTQKLHQKATTRVQDEVAAYREKVDQLILDIWEEVERDNMDLATDQRLDRNRQYGVVYYYRKGEQV
ncbi:MAG TPA: hypothetical protein DDX07_01420 [Porphyromonadaceae bacterium]|jgi:hypothetical protein|nr:hypothetical protein [Porphyromonadaceae bacterium]